MVIFFLKNFKVGHGEGPSKRALDDQTTLDLKVHKVDLKTAEKEVFGHPLSQREWMSLSEDEKKRKSEEMLEVVKSRMEKRFKDTGKY